MGQAKHLCLYSPSPHLPWSQSQRTLCKNGCVFCRPFQCLQQRLSRFIETWARCDEYTGRPCVTHLMHSPPMSDQLTPELWSLTPRSEVGTNPSRALVKSACVSRSSCLLVASSISPCLISSSFFLMLRTAPSCTVLSMNALISAAKNPSVSDATDTRSMCGRLSVSTLGPWDMMACMIYVWKVSL